MPFLDYFTNFSDKWAKLLQWYSRIKRHAAKGKRELNFRGGWSPPKTLNKAISIHVAVFKETAAENCDPSIYSFVGEDITVWLFEGGSDILRDDNKSATNLHI